MNWPRIILDGLAMSLFFNVVAGLGFLAQLLRGKQRKTPKELKPVHAIGQAPTGESKEEPA